MDRVQILHELRFKAIRSSGSGGQHVNKVSSKIKLFFDLDNSYALKDEEKERLRLKLSNRLTKEKIIILQCDESRSQHKNKELVIKRFLDLIESGLKIPKKRRATKPSKAAVEKRLQNKKKVSKKKAGRSKPNLEQ